MAKTHKEAFLEDYEALCELYGMYVAAYWGEVPSDTGTCVEEIAHTHDLVQHIAELKKTP